MLPLRDGVGGSLSLTVKSLIPNSSFRKPEKLTSREGKF